MRIHYSGSDVPLGRRLFLGWGQVAFKISWILLSPSLHPVACCADTPDGSGVKRRQGLVYPRLRVPKIRASGVVSETCQFCSKRTRVPWWSIFCGRVKMPRLGNQCAIWAANWIVKPDDHANGVRCGDRNSCGGRNIAGND